MRPPYVSVPAYTYFHHRHHDFAIIDLCSSISIPVSIFWKIVGLVPIFNHRYSEGRMPLVVYQVQFLFPGFSTRDLNLIYTSVILLDLLVVFCGSMIPTVHGRNPAAVDKYIVYPIISEVWTTSQVVSRISEPSTVPSMGRVHIVTYING